MCLMPAQNKELISTPARKKDGWKERVSLRFYVRSLMLPEAIGFCFACTHVLRCTHLRTDANKKRERGDEDEDKKYRAGGSRRCIYE